VGFFDRRKEKHELNEQDRVSRREAKAVGLELRQTWLAKADDLTTQYAGAIQAASSVSISDMQKTAERVRRIAIEGVDGTATVISARECGEGMSGVGVTLELELSLVSGPGAPRALTVRQDVMGGVESYPPGLEVPIKVDPQNHDDAMIWSDVRSAATDAAPQVPGIDHISRLESLTKLRDQGVLSEERFQELKSLL
jgi:hypothetical protein